MDANTCPTCGSDCNERDELTKAEREITRLSAEVDALKRTHDEAMKRSHEVTQEMARQFETEVEALRADAREVCEWADAAQWALGNETGVPAAKLDALRAAIGVEAAQGGKHG